MTESQRKELGLFRTPIAAAMLTGIPAALLGISMPKATQFLNSLSSSLILQRTMSFTFVALTYVSFLSGPAISQRDLGKFWSALKWGVLVGLASSLVLWTTFPFIYRLSLKPQPHNFEYGIIMFQVARIAVVAAFLTRILCSLYDLRVRLWSIFAAAIIADLIASFIYKLITVGSRSSSSILLADSQDLDVYNVMSCLILNIFWVVLPTIFIERALRKQAALDAATSSTPATAPTASDANNATR